MTHYGQSPRGASVLIVDNYDSFTRNLTALVAGCGVPFTIVENDRVTAGDVLAHSFVLISPGPGLPREAGRTCGLIREFASRKSILGVCLGHQAIAEVFGAALERRASPVHGVSRAVKTTAEPCRLFDGLPVRFEAGFYHSWGVSPGSVPGALAVTAVSDDGGVAALSHRTYDVHGVQFHPESVMTPDGARIIGNWLGVQPLSSTVNSGSSGLFES